MAMKTSYSSNEQVEQFEKDYLEIFSILENSNELYTNRLLYWDSFFSVLFDTSKIIPFFLIFSLITLSFLALFFKTLVAIISLVFWFTIVVLFFFHPFLKKYIDSKNNSKKLIKREAKQGLDDKRISKQLSLSNIAALKYVEQRLKFIIEKRKARDEKLKYIIPLVSLFSAIFIIYSSGDPNIKIPNIMLASGVIVILLGGWTITLDDSELYYRFLSIVEYAQELAEETQQVEPMRLPETDSSKTNLMESLRKHEIDRPSDYDHNL